ncbi:tetratricopeptide repeat protein [Bacillus luti]|nr:aspartate phosphatase [Bacillus cereus]
MNLQIKGKEELRHLLNSWYSEICSEHLEKAESLKKELALREEEITSEGDTHQYFHLLNFRYEILLGKVSEETLRKVDQIKVVENKQIEFHYHLFKAIYNTNNGHFNEAKIHFEKLEEIDGMINGVKEKAEWDYRLAIYYYQTYQPLSSIRHVMQAEKVFQTFSGSEVLLASCENIYGLCSITIGKYGQAEVYFLSALDKAKKVNSKPWEKKIKHNLGLLYADQGNPELAVKYLSDSLKDNLKTVFLLAREYYKMGHREEVNQLILKGYDLCNEEYQHHFNILKELNEPSSIENLELLINKGISYFEKEELWKYVVDYLEVIAVQLHTEGDAVKASEYFYKAYQAKQKTENKGVLK